MRLGTGFSDRRYHCDKSFSQIVTAIKEQLLQEIEETPESLLEEVLNFLRTVKQQNAIQPSQDSKQETVGQQILKFAAEFRASIPPEELAKLPSDGAEQHDHYIYGTPKRSIE